MRLLSNIPIQKKVTRVILLTCSLALLTAATVVLGVQYITLQQNIIRDISAIARIIAYNSSAALTFGDAKSSEEILLALKARPNIIHACLVLPDGEVFAEYGETDPLLVEQFIGQKTDYTFVENKLFYLQPVMLEADQIGSLVLQLDYEPEFMDLLKLQASVLIGVLLVSILLAFLLSRRLQRVISDPILKLAQTAGMIAEHKDYSVRAEALEEDELGLFTDAFNQMLEQIEQQASALQMTHAELEKQVDNLQHEINERRNAETALRHSEQRYRMLFQSNPLPLWVFDLETFTFLAVNDSACDHYGYTEQEFLTMTLKDISPSDEVPKLIHQVSQTESPFRQAGVWLHRKKDGTVIEVEITAHELLYLERRAQIMLVNDVTERELARKELEVLNQQLMDASRQAGMAEVATGVLHNVGNVLNSVNVSTTLIQDRIRQSRMANLAKIASLIQNHKTDLADFITHDKQGRYLPEYLIKLADNASDEQTSLLSELDVLIKNLNHIKSIVSMQQSYAKTTGGVIEMVRIDELMDDAIQITTDSMAQDHISLMREYTDVIALRVDRHKVIQVLVNLLTNACQAVIDLKGIREAIVTICIFRRHKDRLTITVADNGVGISKDHLTRIFASGFTSREEGHGFGLHSSALAVKEMGGSLTASSDGPDTGATFTLELPITKENPDYESACYDGEADYAYSGH